jgi:hypothetical protein
MIQFTDMASTVTQAPAAPGDGWAPTSGTAALSTAFAVHPASLVYRYSERRAGSTATKFPYTPVSGVRKEPVFGRVLLSLPLGGCIREKQHRISIRCFSSEAKTDPGREARWR